MLIKSKSNFILNDGLLTYFKENKWYLPLEDLFDSIAVEYKFAENQRIIEGYIFNEKNSYRIDLDKCEIQINDKTHDVSCSSFIPLDDFLLVDIDILEILTPITFEINSLNSSITLIYSLLFPPEERHRRASKKSEGKRHETVYPVSENTRDWIGGLNFDQDISIEYFRSQNNKKKSIVRHETSLSTELLKSELYADYRGVGKDQESSWISLERNDYKKRIFGDVGLSEIKVVNFTAPNIDLIGGGQTLTGGYLSNRSLSRPTNFSKENFSGVIENGWEVELYHNDLLIGREVGSSEKQRYEFNDVDLYYGMNRFQFIFYGPKGEMRYENKTLDITNSFDKQSGITVTAAYGKDQYDKDNYNLSLSKNVFERFQIGLHTVKDYEIISNESNKYFGGSVSTFLDSTLIDIHYVSNEGSRAIESSAKFNFLGASTNLSYINNTGVRSVYLGYVNPIDYSWNGNFLMPLKFAQNLQMYNSIKYKKRRGIDTKYLDILNRLSFSMRKLYLSNTLTVENNVFINEIFSRYSLGNSTFKLTKKVDKEGIRNSDLGYTFSNRKEYSFSSNFNYEYFSKISTLNFRADKRFQKYYAGVSLEASSNEELGISFNLSYGLIYDEDNGVDFFNRRTSEYANIKVLAYYDKNGNGIRELDEAMIPDVEFYRLAGNEKQSTSNNGFAFFTFVQPLLPTDIKISLKNIDNIYLKPESVGQTVWGRAGKTALLEFPLRIEGDIEGEIEFLGEKILKKKVKASIISKGRVVKEFPVEKDGYFYSQGILPGDYTLKVTCDKCLKKEFSEEFSMPKDGDSLFFEGVSI